jgi:hypothetical protein
MLFFTQYYNGFGKARGCLEKHDGGVSVKIVLRMFSAINANLSVKINPADIPALIFIISEEKKST